MYSSDSAQSTFLIRSRSLSHFYVNPLRILPLALRDASRRPRAELVKPVSIRSVVMKLRSFVYLPKSFSMLKLLWKVRPWKTDAELVQLSLLLPVLKGVLWRGELSD